MNELPPHLASLIAEARSAHNPSAADRERVFTALMGGLATATVASQLAQNGLEASSSAASSGLGSATGAATGGLISKLVVLGALTLGGAGLWTWSRTPVEPPARSALPAPQRGAPEQAVAPLESPAESASKPAVLAPALPQPETPSDTTSIPEQAAADSAVRTAVPSQAERPRSGPRRERGASASRRTTARGDGSSNALNSGTTAAIGSNAASAEPTSQPTAPDQPSAASANVPPPGTTPASELSLLRGTLTALRDAQPARALRLLEEHGERFPSGGLAQERRGLRVVALCQLGQLDAGRREQAAFLRQDGSSALAERVRTACPSGGEP